MLMLWGKIKKILKKNVPAPVLNLFWKLNIILKIPLFFNIAVTYCYFFFSKKKTQRLNWEELDKLQKRYPCPCDEVTMQSLVKNAKWRIKLLLDTLPQGEKPDSLLETGAGHGLFSIIASREYNIDSTAIDLDFKENSELDKGEIPFRVMDVSQMDFDDNTFDCVVSFDAFEHFMEPETALKEMIRVTKPKGFIFLFFGPIYYSALGMHIYRSIHVPYSQYLFDYDMLEAYMEKNKIPQNFPATNNEWYLEQYDQLWDRYSCQADIVYKKVSKDYRCLELIRAYPGLFKAQTKKFSDLTSNHIQILFQKK